MNTNGSRQDHPSVMESKSRRQKGRRPRSGPEPLEQRIAPASLIVTNANSGGPGSLRDAILQANALPGFDTISFNIGGTGPHVIQLNAAEGPLPAITDPVLIDGYSQPGSSPNTAATTTPRSNALLDIVLDGSLLSGGDGLALNIGNSTIAGLVIQGFDGAGIRISGSGAINNVIAGNFIGTDASGTTANANAGGGIIIFQAGNNQIGTPQPSGRNIISGNGSDGILIDSAQVSPGFGNIIFNNLIGRSRDGSALGNFGNGITIRDSTNHVIGGIDVNQPNFISFNTGNGVAVGVNSPLPEDLTFGNAIRGNSILDNVQLGINLGRDGVTPNDPGDFDNGANGRVNFPFITNVNVLSSISIISGFVQSAPNTSMMVDFYVSARVDASGFGEGGRYIGSLPVTTDATGNGPINFSASGDFRGMVFTATNNDLTRKDTSEFSLGFSPLLVTTENDVVDATDGLTSLREAINFANSDPDFSIITFNIPGTGVHSIHPATKLPDITTPVFIDGYSQPGASPNTLALGNDGVLLVELDGSSLTGGAQIFGLTLSGGNSTVRGLVVKNFFDGGININGPGGNVIIGNWIGTNADGITTSPASNKDGIDIINSSNNTIGGALPAEHNIISGNILYPINIRGGIASVGNVIKGNAIGTTKDGTATLGNGGELYIDGNGTILGTSEPGGRNVISTTAAGIDAVAIHSAGVTVQHNAIGIDLTGTVTLGVGGAGVHVFSPNATIGGSGPNEGNIISGAGLGGILIESDGATVQGNFIGTDATGTIPRPNSVAGIVIARGLNNSIGGTGSSAGNIIAFNNGDGVWVNASTGIATGNAIRGNSIFGNTGLGINLGSDGVTPNDALDGDFGANTLQNFPVITTATRGVTGTSITGTLNSTANAVFTIDFYANLAGDPSGFGEGRVYLGSTVTGLTNGSGNVTFNFTSAASVPQGSVITATATSSSNDTSEFSAVRTLSTQFVWDAGGGVDTSWDNPLNWDFDSGIPTATDTAILGINATITLPANRSVGTYQQSNGIFSGGPGTTFNVLNNLDWTGGTMTGGGTTSVGGTLTMSGAAGKTLNFGYTLTNTTAANLSGGTLFLDNGSIFSNNGVFNAIDDADIGGGGPAGIFKNAGTFNKTGTGTTTIIPGFNSTGAVSVATGSTLALSGGGIDSGTFGVPGTAVLEFGGGTHNLNAGTNFSGTGTVRFSGGVTNLNAGTYNVGATSITGGTAAFGVAATTGTLDVSGGFRDGPGTLTVSGLTTFTGGSMTSAGTTIANGGLSIFGSGGKTLNFGHTLVNNGTATFSGGALLLDNSSTFTNNNVFNATNNVDIGGGGTASAFVNAGTFNKSGAGTTTNITRAFNNSGTVNVDFGSLAIGGGGTSSGGTFDVDGGATLNFSNNYTANAPTTVTGAGAAQFTGGTVDLNGTYTITGATTISGSANFNTAVTLTTLNLLGILGGSGNVTISNALVWSNGSMTGASTTTIGAGTTLTISGAASKTLNFGRTLVNNGTTNLSSGTLLLDNGSLFDNNGTFNVVDDADIGGGGLSASFQNDGTLNKSGAGTTTAFSRAFNNAGTVNVDSGTLAIGGGGTNSGGTFDVDPGATVNFTNDYSLGGTTNLIGAGFTRLTNGTLTITGTTNAQNFAFDAGTINGTGTLNIGAALQWASGSMSDAGTTTIGATATLTISGAAPKTLNFSRALVNNGTANLSGGTLFLDNGSTLTNNSVLNVTDDADIGGAGAAATFANTGTFNKTGTGTVTTFSRTFNNSGTVNIPSGTLNFTGSYTQTAGALSLGGGNLGGGITFAFQGGDLRGSGTITGSVSNTGATVRPGGTGTAGTLTITGAYTQGASGTLAADLGGIGAGQFDVLAVGGTATLGGTLNLANIGGFIPTAGNQFRVVTSSNNPGNFATLTGAATGITQQPDASGLVIQANALVYTWDGGAGPGNTSWFDPLNWDLDLGFPGPADTAILSNAGNNTITIPSSLSVGTFQQSTGTVTSNAGVTFTILNEFDWAGGTQTGAGATTVPAGATLNFTLGNTTLNTRTLNIAGTATDSVSGGSLTLTNGATINLSGTVDFQNDDDIFASGTGTSINILGGVLKKTAGTLTTEIQPTITINGIVDSQLGLLQLSNVIGGNSATFNASGAGGIVELSGGSGPFSGTTTFTGGGVTRIVDANLQFVGPTNLTGAGTKLDITGTGAVAIANTLTVPAGTTLGLAVGTLTGAGTIDVAGTFDWTSGAHRGTGVTNILPGGVLNMAAPTAKLLSVRTINHAGDAALQGSLAMENGATFNLSGRLDLLNDADLISGSSGNFTVQSGGLLRKFSGAGLSDIAPGVALSNSGTIEVDAGTLRIGNAAGGNGATFQPAAGAVLEIAGGNGVFTGTPGNNGANGITRISGGNLQFSGASLFTGSGARFEITNGALTLGNTLTIGAGATLALSAGALGGTGNVDVLGALEWSGGTMSGAGTTSIAATATATLSGAADKLLVGRTFTNAGTVNWSGTGQFALNNATVNNSGAFNLQSDAVVSVTGGAPVFNNLASGTLSKSGGAGTSTFSIGIAVNNAGTIAAQTGTLDLGSSFTQTGGTTLLGPGGLASPGTLTFQAGELRGSGTIAGSVNNVGATLRPGGTGLAGAIAISGAYTQGAAATLAMEIGGLNAGTQYDQLNVGGTATLGGTFDVTLLGGFVLPSGSQFQVLNSSTRTGTFAIESIAPGLTRQYTPTGVLLVGPAPPPSTVVTTELDVVDPLDGLVSLREAIIFANGNAGLDTITFNIPGTGVHTIALGSALPTITDAVVIDGYTQPGALPNTTLSGNNAVLLIELNGSSAGIADGLQITSGGSTVRGLVMNGFGGEAAILLTGGSGNVISGNFIGTNAAGTAAGPANVRGIFISGSSNNMVGGTSPGDRNIISGGQQIGVDIAFGAAGNFVQGNFIGTDKTGKVALGNSVVGVFINNSPGNFIGGTTAGARNIISGNALSAGTQGISIGGGAGATGNLVQGNFIGTDVTGAIALGNSTGVIISQGAQGNTIGGNIAGAANIISGNTGVGVQLSDPGTSGNVVAGNFIGTDLGGTLNLGNATHGVQISNGTSGNTIGGFNAADGNLITHNGLEGVTIFTGSGNAILHNSIHSNGGFEIDLGGNGFTPNDPGDGDTGANDLQNFPVLTQVTPDPGGTRVNGTLNSAPNTTYRIEFFQSDVVDGNGVGEGKVFLGFQDVTTDSSGNASFSVVVPTSLAINQFVTATATNSSLNNTSEFAVAAKVLLPGTVSIADAIIVEGDSGTRTIVFHATLDRAVGSTVMVNYNTVDRTAFAGLDYDAASGVITFGPNETEQTFSITVHGDTLAEFRERFAVVLSNPQGVSIGDGEAIGVIQDDDHHSFAIGQGAGNSFRVYTLTGSGATLQAELQPFASGYKGGVRVATGDVNGDGVDDFIAGAGLGGRGHVRVFDGATLDPLAGPLGDFKAYGDFYRGGIFVAAGDVNGDGLADVIVAPSAGSHNEVRIFSGADGSMLSSFQALNRGSGGVRVAAGDVNGDGLADIIVGAGLGSKVRVFDGLSGTLLPGHEFAAFDRTFRGGVFVAAGDMNNDGFDDVIVGGGSKSATIKIFGQGEPGSPTSVFSAYTGALRGVHVAAGDINGDGIAEIIATKGAKTDGKIHVFQGTSLAKLFDFTPFGKADIGNYPG